MNWLPINVTTAGLLFSLVGCLADFERFELDLPLTDTLVDPSVPPAEDAGSPDAASPTSRRPSPSPALPSSPEGNPSPDASLDTDAEAEPIEDPDAGLGLGPDARGGADARLDATNPLQPPPEYAIACNERGAVTFQRNGHCYFRSTLACADWSRQQQVCASLGAHLVTMTSSEEQAFVKRSFPDAQAWIGLARFHNYPFVWVTGESFAFTFWGADSPKRSADACVSLRDRDARWIDRDCHSERSAICERSR